MGITSGYGTVGNSGSDRRMSYTIIGRPVNLASGLEGAAPTDGIRIAKPTWPLVNEPVHCASSEPVIAKGFDEPVEVYKVVGSQDPRKTASVIQGSSTGLSPWLDPGTAEDDRDAVIEHLRRALEAVQDGKRE